MTNEKFGQLFNTNHSVISHCVKAINEKMNKDKKLNTNLKYLIHNTSLDT